MISLVAGDPGEHDRFEWLFIEHRQIVWLVQSLALLAIGLGWSIRMGAPEPLYVSLATAALWVGSDALTWRRGGRARRRYELAKLPPPPRPPQPLS